MKSHRLECAEEVGITRVVFKLRNVSNVQMIGKRSVEQVIMLIEVLAWLAPQLCLLSSKVCMLRY